MTTVSFQQAAKFFGTVAAVSDLTLDIADGEFMVLLPSGSGKTTALRLLAGLEGLSSGHLRIGDVTVDRMSPRDRRHCDGLPGLRPLPADVRRLEHGVRA